MLYKICRIHSLCLVDTPLDNAELLINSFFWSLHASVVVTAEKAARETSAS